MSRVPGFDGWSPALHQLVVRLDEAASLAEVVGAVIEAVAAVDAVGLLDRHATPVAVVARPPLDPGWLRAYLAGAWRYDGALAELLVRHAPVPAPAAAARRLGGDGALGPLAGGARLLGFVGFAAGAAHDAVQVVCLHASLRLAELGVTRIDGAAVVGALDALRARGLVVVARPGGAPDAVGGRARA